jgi:hypothetical protein
MSEIFLVILRSGKKWTLTKPEIRIGSNQDCDVALSGEEFPTVGGEHAVIRTEGSLFWVEDLGSMNGTLVNGHRLSQEQQLVPGDVIGLGSDGPEIRASFVSDQIVSGQAVAEVPALRSATAPTIPSGEVGSPSSTVDPAKPEIHTFFDTRTFQVGAKALPEPDHGKGAANQSAVADQVPTMPSQPAATLASRVLLKEPGETLVRDDPFARTIPSPNTQKAHIGGAPGSDPFVATVQSSPDGNLMVQGGLSDSLPVEAVSEEGERKMEKTLKMIRNVVFAIFALLLILGGVMLSEMQKIDENRRAILKMRAEAGDAVQQLQPKLDERLKKLEGTLASAQDQMNGIDDKIRQSEDGFVQRMNTELPKIMDRYWNTKIAELKAELKKEF